MDLISKTSFTRSSRLLSKVWLFFGFKADGTGKPAKKDELICRMCRRKVLAKDGNTTNARSHLKIHHPDVFQIAFATNATGPELSSTTLSGGSMGLEENIDFSMPQSVPENHIADAVILGEPGMQGGVSRAVASLPICLSLRETASPGGSSQEAAGEELRVFAKSVLLQGWVFGPFRGEVAYGQLTNFKYAWVVKAGEAYYNVDASDENKSNWMRFVACTTSEEEHNMNVFQWEQQIYYRVTKPIHQGSEVKVCIGKDYAALLLGLGLGENIKCEYGDKEILLGLFQDIQVVPVGGPSLPEASGSHGWSDSSQSGSPMPVISDIIGSPHAEDLAASVNYPLDRQDVYDFVEGAEKLLNHPHAAQARIWFFFGFKVDPGASGLPVDKSKVVCKLCGESVSFNGRMADMQSHLIQSHHMQHQNIIGNKGRPPSGSTPHRVPPLPAAPFPSTPQNIGDLESWSSPLCPEVPTPRPISTPPHLSATQTANAIADFLIRDLLPPSTVEGEGFRQLVRTLLPPSRELPSAWQMDGILAELHDRGRDAWARLLTADAAAAGAEEKGREPAGQTARPKSRAASRRKARGGGGAEVRVPHRVTLSAEVWRRDRQGAGETHVTLWAHFVDADFAPHTLALGTRRLGGAEGGGGGGGGGLRAAEAEARAMALEWGVARPCAVVVGGEESETMRLAEEEEEGAAGRRGGDDTAGGGAPHPNSTTFLEREDSVSGDELSGPEQARPAAAAAAAAEAAADFPPVPCFLAVVEGCVQKVMSHPAVSGTLGLFRRQLADLFRPREQQSGGPAPRLHRPTHRPLADLGQRDLAELRSWAHAEPEWSRLYGVLQTLLLHQAAVSDALKDASGGATPGDASSSNAAAAVLPKPSDWKVLEDLCSALKPLDVACRTVAKEPYSRLSLVKPVLIGLLSRHLALRPGASPVSREVKKVMSDALAGCYGHPGVNRVLCLASALDPQFHGLRFMKPEDQAAAFDWLKKEAVRMEEDRRRGQADSAGNRGGKRDASALSPWETDGDAPRRSKRLKEATPISFKQSEEDDDFDDHEEEESQELSEASSPGYQEEEDEDEDDGGGGGEPAVTTEQNGVTGMEFLLGDLYGPPLAQSKQPSVEECAEVEVSLYRAEKDLALGDKSSLDWWRAKAGLLPLLARVAQAYLAAPAVAGGAARAFLQEGGGAMHRKNRENVPSEALDQLLFLHHNGMSTSAPPGKNF